MGEAPLVLDLGCGDGRDSALFLAQGWRVVGIDQNPEAIRRATERFAGAAASGQFRGVVSDLARSLDDPAWLEARLAHSAFVLPFLPRKSFDPVWARMRQIALDGGALSAILFGPEDDWAYRLGTCVDHDDVTKLLEGLTIAHRDERINHSPTAKGEMKCWHIHEVVGIEPA